MSQIKMFKRKASKSNSKQISGRIPLGRRGLALALVAVLVFSTVGAWLVFTSRAETYNLTYEGCYVRGRKGAWIPELRDYLCYSGESSCRDGAGTWKPNGDGYGYCSNAVSTSIGRDRCVNELHRQYVGLVGCARSWKQGIKDQPDSLQCYNNDRTYHVRSPYDYCGTISSTSGGSSSSSWLWPVTPNTGVGGFGSGHYARDFDGGKDTAVRAVATGDIVWKGQISSACGNGLILKTTKPGGGETYAVYEHIRFSGASGRVTQGTVLGWMNVPPSPSGGCWYGYHLHLGIQTHGNYIESHRSTYHTDPCTFIPGC